MKVYKTLDEKKPGVTLLYIRKEISDEEHSRILKLHSLTDLIFIFSRDFKRGISGKRFSSLYEATYYGIFETKEEGLEIWEMIDYVNEFTNYFSYSVILQEDLTKLTKPELDNLGKLQESLTVVSTFSRRRLSNSEFKDIYNKKSYNILNFFNFIFDTKGESGIYVKWTTEDNLLFLRPHAINKIKARIDEEILKTFKGFGIKPILSSLINPEDLLNKKLGEITITP